MDWKLLREDRLAALVNPDDCIPKIKKVKEAKPIIHQVDSDESEDEAKEVEERAGEDDGEYNDSFESSNYTKEEEDDDSESGIIAKKFRKLRKVVEVKKKNAPNRMTVVTKKVSITNDSFQPLPDPEPEPEPEPIVNIPSMNVTKPSKKLMANLDAIPVNEELSREASNKILQELQLRKQKRFQPPQDPNNEK